MFKFENKQDIFKIGDVEIGGQPGELPPVLIGSIFHEGHGIVKDREHGVFNADKARKLLIRQERISKKTGIPHMLDVVAETEEAMEKNIDFVTDHSQAPFLINAPTASVRVHGVQHAKDSGVLHRSVYDSINYRIDEVEIEAIRKTGVKAAVVQAFNPRFPMPVGMIRILKGEAGEEGLLEKTKRAGIEKPLLFAPVLDLPGVGFGAAGVFLLKKEFGLPSGTAPVGVVGRSRQVRSMKTSAKKGCRAGVVSLSQAMGSDYIIYGSLARAGEIFLACAVVDAAITYNARTLGIRPRSSFNPLSALFRSRT